MRLVLPLPHNLPMLQEVSIIKAHGVVHVFVPRPLWATHLHEQHVPSKVVVEVRDPDPQGMYLAASVA
jgi:hypothetical protein